MDARTQLATICGAEHVRSTGATSVAGTADAVAGALGGRRPDLVAAPADTEQVAAVLRAAAEHGLAVVPTGRGTKLGWGLPPERADLLLDLSRLDSVLEHAADDFVVRVGAGMPLAALNETLAPAGQRLALDEVVPGSTVGGVIATGLSGPARLLYGGVRDLLLGVTVVRADGAVTRSGGKVVKNVAGYDLGKLYTGSYGTLGVVTEATFRLHPLPAARAFVLARFGAEGLEGTASADGGAGAEAAAQAVAAVTASQTVPTAVELHRAASGADAGVGAGADGSIDVAVLLEGIPAGVRDRADAVARLLGPGATVSAAPPPWWGALPGATTIRISIPRAALADLLAAVRQAADTAAVPVTVTGSAGLAVLYVGLGSVGLGSAGPASVDPGPGGSAAPPGSAEPGELAAPAAALLTAVRAAAAAAGGNAVVLRAPAAIAAGLDVWGPVPALDLMRRVKREFDPDRRLAPGRFVGGI